MPWRECSVMEERLRFVARLLEGEAMTDVCREFGISRKTGYKIFNRYQDQGLDALCDRSRRPVRYANQLPAPIERLIVDLKRDKPHWGARKIRELLVRKFAGDVRIPAKSTVHAVLDRHGLVKRARERRSRAKGTPLSAGASPNELWCADFKGEFKLGNGRYCYPLTVTDHASRYLLLCEALESTREGPVIEAFQQLFRERGLPVAIRSDNGLPFASPNALFNLSKLSVWWLRLGITIRAHQTRSSPAERPPRAHASHAEKRSHSSCRRQSAAAASQVRRLLRGVQQRAAARSARYEMSRRALFFFLPPVSRSAGTQLSVPRQNRRRHQRRPPMSLPQQDQLKHLFGWTSRRGQGSRRRHLARQLHGLRSRLGRSGGENFAAPAQSLRAKSVTYVLGTICYLCVRSGQRGIWLPERDTTRKRAIQ